MTDCLRCDRSFKTQSARAQHISDSSRHNICRECYYLEDFETPYELREHMIDEHNGCTQCNDTFESARDLRQHLYDEHNMCSVCKQCFSSPSNLKYVCSPHSETVYSHALWFSVSARLICPTASARSPREEYRMFCVLSHLCDQIRHGPAPGTGNLLVWRQSHRCQRPCKDLLYIRPVPRL